MYIKTGKNEDKFARIFFLIQSLGKRKISRGYKKISLNYRKQTFLTFLITYKLTLQEEFRGSKHAFQNILSSNFRKKTFFPHIKLNLNLQEANILYSQSFK